MFLHERPEVVVEQSAQVVDAQRRIGQPRHLLGLRTTHLIEKQIHQRNQQGKVQNPEQTRQQRSKEKRNDVLPKGSSVGK